MIKGVGSSKVRNANNRIAKERKFLGSISVQCDDESLIDSLIGDDGQTLPIKDVLNVAEHHEAIQFVAPKSKEIILQIIKCPGTVPGQIRLSKDMMFIPMALIHESFRVIASCQATVKKFSGR